MNAEKLIKMWEASGGVVRKFAVAVEAETQQEWEARTRTLAVLTKEDLDSLPVGTIIRSEDGGIAEKYEAPGPGMWPFWVAHKYRIHQKELWPATAIYTPNEEKK